MPKRIPLDADYWKYTSAKEGVADAIDRMSGKNRGLLFTSANFTVVFPVKPYNEIHKPGVD